MSRKHTYIKLTTTEAMADEMCIIGRSIEDWMSGVKKKLKEKARSFAWHVFDVLVFITYPLWFWAKDKLYEYAWSDEEEAQDE